MFKITGTIKVIGEKQQVTDTFAKRDLVIREQSTQYPQDLLFQLAQDKCSLLDKFAEGEQVEVSFNLRGREWTSPTGEVKYFNTLDASRIEADSSESSNEEEDDEEEKPKKKKKKKKAEAEDDDEEEDDDDLPF